MDFKQLFQRGVKGKNNPVTERKNSGYTRFASADFGHLGYWSRRDFESLTRNGFEENAIAYRCIRLVSEAGASVPIKLYEQGEELLEHPILDVLRRPNREQSLPDLMERFYSYLQVTGNAYLEYASSETGNGQIYILRPDRMRVLLDEQGWPCGYEYQLGAKKQKYNIPLQGQSPILHHKLFHPGNDHYGMSPLSAASKSIDIHNGASGWNKALFDNLARPSGALVYKGPDGAPNMTDEQFERLKSELAQNYQGAQNAGRPLLLEGGLDWMPLSLSPHDMDFIEAKNLSAREIALAFGVPPMLLGIPGDNSYANYAEANRAFWRQTVLPMVQRALTALGQWLASTDPQAVSSHLRLEGDLNAIPALAEERSRLWQRISKADFLTINEKRQALGFGLIENGDELKRKGVHDED